jgi:tetratricopeptide (TPR) repeat protein
MRLVRWSIVWAVVGMAVLLGAADGWAQTATEQCEAAVLKAPAGRMAEAQADLRALLANGTDDGLVAMDLATLLQQDGNAAEAVEVFEKAAKPDPPDYALLAATRAYRDLRRYGDAARLARQGLQRFPADSVWPLLLSLVLSDDGKSTEALAVLRTPAAQAAPPVERLMAEAYAWRRAGDPAARPVPAAQGAHDLDQPGPGPAISDAAKPWPPLIVADHTPRWVRWRDFALTLMMWILFAIMLETEFELFVGPHLERWAWEISIPKPTGGRSSDG